MDNELLFKMETMHQQVKEAEEKVKVIDQQVEELQQFQETLESLDKNKEKELLTPLGKGVFVKTDVKDEKLFLEVGAGVLVRKNIAETKAVIKDQTNRLNQMRIQVSSEYEALYTELQTLMQSAQAAVE